MTRLVEGTLERRIELDYIIDQFSSVKVKKHEAGHPGISYRMSVYQLKYMDSACRIPRSATRRVKLAQRKGFRQSEGLCKRCVT